MTERLPLDGVRVADLSRVVAGPYGSYLLARFGAEVIRIEDYDPVDSMREAGPFSDDAKSLNRAGYFASLNGGKKSVALHFADPAQAVMAKDLMLACDVVIENFPAGWMERFGFGFEALAAAKPAMVMVSASGFGRTGAMRSYRAYMNTVAAFVGLTATNGYEGGRAIPVGATLSDFSTGTTIALAAVIAVREARRTGTGSHVDISMAETTMSLMGEPFVDYFVRGRVPERRGNAHRGHAPSGVYPSKGGDKWIAISVSADVQWSRLVECMGSPAWCLAPGYSTAAGRIEHRGELDDHIGRWTAAFDNIELAVRLQSMGVPALPSSDPEDLVRNPHLAARGTIATQEFALEPGRKMPNLPWRFARHPGLNAHLPPPPVIGQDNAALLAATGVSAADIVSLTSAASAAVERMQESGS